MTKLPDLDTIDPCPNCDTDDEFGWFVHAGNIGVACGACSETIKMYDPHQIVEMLNASAGIPSWG